MAEFHPARIASRLDELWSIALGPGGGADRPAFSAAEARAISLVAGWAADQGLTPGLDWAGNLWALPGAGAGALAGEGAGALVTAGSHVDTVPDGGRYDGALGTVLGLELAAALAPNAGVMVCCAEEAPRFGAGTIGSRLLAGTLTVAELDGFVDTDGVSARAAREQYLQFLSGLPRLDRPPLARVRAHAEIHVAQRRALRTLGVVTTVAAPRRLEVVITGAAGHSGEVSMADRRDALTAAAQLILAVEAAGRAQPSGTVATVGTLAVSPGALSVIPGRVVLGVDARSTDGAALDALEAAVRDAAAALPGTRGVDATVRLLRGGAPTELDASLVRAAGAAATRLSIDCEPTWSGAGHDAQHLAALFPTLLLFVPLHGGESHTPSEGASIPEALQAAAVAAEVLGERLAAPAPLTDEDVG